MITKFVRRYEVPVGPPVAITLSTPRGQVLRAEARSSDEGIVEFWVEHIDDGSAFVRMFQVFGTGHALPATVEWCATTARTPSGLVWHLYEWRDIPQKEHL